MKGGRWIAWFCLVFIVGGTVLSCARTANGHELTLEDFDFLYAGISLEKVIQTVGEPDRDVGSGFYMPAYDLKEGGTVILQFGGNPNHLIAAEYEGPAGTRVLVPKEE